MQARLIHRRPMKALVSLFVMLCLVAAGAALWLARTSETAQTAGPSLESLIDPDVQGFAEVAEDATLRFPADHGVHSGFRSEIWNLFGHLVDAQGISYDVQFNLTRLALSPDAPERPSAWAANAIYRGQLTLLQADRDGVRSAERLTREALGLAGGASDPPAVWIQDWSLSYVVDEPERTRIALVAEGAGGALTLDLAAVKAPIAFAALALLGRDAGALGLAAYLLPRLSVTGTLVLDGESRPVQGHAWLDHAWGTLPTSGGQVGLNRFAIQLDDARELICLRLRREDGTGTPIPACALIRADGQIQSFQRREITLEPTSRWRSPRTGSAYPVAWQLAIPILDLELELRALVQDQESAGAIPLWSGAVQAAGRQGAAPIGGRGRIETTADPVDGSSHQ